MRYYGPFRSHYEAPICKAGKTVERLLSDTGIIRAHCPALLESPDCVYVHDFHGRIVDANETWLELLGYGRHEISSLNLFSLLTDDDTALTRRLLGELERHGVLRTRHDLRLERKNGDGVDLEVSVSLLSVKERAPVVLAVARDVSQRKQAEREARQREQAQLRLKSFSAELSMLPSKENLEAFILRQLMDITEGVGAVFVEHDPAQRTLTVVDFDLDRGFVEKVTSMLGRQLIGMQSILPDDLLRDVSKEIVRVSKTLYEASFGAAPRKLGSAVEAFLRIDHFIGVAYLLEGGLYGMSVVAMGKGKPDPPLDMLKDFSFLVASALRRKRAETALRESEERYRLLTESASDVFWTTDTEGFFTYVSPSVERLRGYTPQELLGQRISSALTPESAAAAETALANAIAQARSGQPVPEFRRALEQPCKNGSRVWTEHRASTLHDASGRWIGFVGVTRDITESRRAAESLRASEAKYRTVVDNIHEGIVVVAPGRVLYHNAQIAEMLGYTVEELAEVGFGEGVHPDDRAAVVNAVASMIERGAPNPRRELRLLTKSGDLRIVRSTASAIDWQGEPAVIIFLEDITERKAAETALRESQERYQSLVNLSPDAILVLSAGQYRFANLAAARLLGADSPEELVGLEGIERVHPDFHRMVTLGAAQVDAGGVAPPREIKLLRLDGSEVEVEATASGINFMGSFASQVVFRDITERKRAEARQHELELQLLERQKLESLGVLAGGIAHDFNNMLTAIIGYSDIIIASDVASPEATLGDVREIREAAERAKDLTRAILAFSRRQPREARVLPLGDLVTELEPLLRRTLGEDIDFVCDSPTDDCLVEMDPSQFTQVIMNLVVNARDAMPAGGTLTLEIARRHFDDDCDVCLPAHDGDWAVLTVSDTGVGIQPGLHSRIFEPFFTTKEPGEGTGLGLSTVYGIVRQSGGDIRVHSEWGGGTTFEVLLPCVKGHGLGRDDQPVPFGGETHDEGSDLVARKTVLLVEDEPAVRKLAIRVLQEQGYTVLAAPDGSQALKIAQDPSFTIDLLLTDVVLPGGPQGDEVARDVLEVRPDLKVVYMSGYPREGTLGSRRLADGIHYLEKPFTADNLVAKLREAMEIDRSAPR